ARPAALAANGGPASSRLSELVGHPLVSAVVPRHRNEGRLAQVERAAERRKELPPGWHRESGYPERAGELDESGVAELRRERSAKKSLLVRFDHPKPIVDEHHADDGRPSAVLGLEVLHIHPEPA